MQVSLPFSKELHRSDNILRSEKSSVSQSPHVTSLASRLSNRARFSDSSPTGFSERNRDAGVDGDGAGVDGDGAGVYGRVCACTRGSGVRSTFGPRFKAGQSTWCVRGTSLDVRPSTYTIDPPMISKDKRFLDGVIYNAYIVYIALQVEDASRGRTGGWSRDRARSRERS